MENILLHEVDLIAIHDCYEDYINNHPEDLISFEEFKTRLVDSVRDKEIQNDN
jgi:hypothetical protein